MRAESDAFRRSIDEQIALNKARTPTQRLLALCDLLDAARALAPRGPAARERRLRALTVRARNREQFRDFFRRLTAAGRTDAPEGV